MSPEAIRSLIGLFGVEKGLHIANVFAAEDRITNARRLRTRPIRKHPQDRIRDLCGLKAPSTLPATLDEWRSQKWIQS